MPDVTDVLEQEHRVVEQLFEEYQRSSDPAVAERICDELALHTRAEEQVVYPTLRRDVAGGPELAHEAEQEHGEVDDLIEQVRRAGFGSDEAPGLLQTLEHAVEHHIEEEESETFPTMRATLAADQLEAMAEQVGELRARPQAGAAPRATRRRRPPTGAGRKRAGGAQG
ncbi:MAG TPA: hemerythrin domain-containing protein [Acidimicrobiales bacterium]|nr:hemerythrin domain-containing protein [Acidimicrobiales bacterium]